MRMIPIRLLTALVLLLVAVGSAQAAIFSVDAVLAGDSSFGASLFHTATPLMGGSTIASIPTTSTNASGTYNSVTGVFSATLPVIPNGGAQSFFTLTGNLLFDRNGALAADSTLTLDFASNALSAPFTDTALGFQKGQICCGSNGPNSFLDGSGDSKILTLWGADGTNFDGQPTFFSGTYEGPTLGMDLRLELTPVPLPPAVWLFGSALVGLVGVARRNRGRFSAA